MKGSEQPATPLRLKCGDEAPTVIKGPRGKFARLSHVGARDLKFGDGPVEAPDCIGDDAENGFLGVHVDADPATAVAIPAETTPCQ